MIYKINGDFYLKVQGYYKPIIVSFDGVEPIIKINEHKEKLEVNNIKDYVIVSLDEIKTSNMNQEDTRSYKRK